MKKDNNFINNFVWNLLGVTFNAFLSFLFLIAVTRINGLNEAGIFTLAFSTACILYVIGTYSGRIFQVTESKTISDKSFIVSRIITCMIMLLCTLIFVLVRQYSFYKCSVFFLLAIYKALEAFSDVLYGILQKNELLNKVGKSYFIKALLSVITFIICDYITNNLILACCFIIIIWIIVILFYDLKNVKKLIPDNSKYNKNEIKKIFKNGFFVFAITFLAIYILNAPKYSIDSFGTEEMQAIFGIIIMPATVMGLIGQLIIHPYLNTFLGLYEENKLKEYVMLLIKIVFFILFTGIIACLCGYYLGPLVLGYIYNINLNAYALNLLFILAAGTFYTIGSIISALLTSMKYNFIQFILYSITSIIEGILCFNLVFYNALNGATLAYFLSMIIFVTLLLIAFIYNIVKRFKKGGKNEYSIYSKR